MGNLLGKRLGLAQRAKEVLKSAGGENVSSTGESSVDVKKTDRDWLVRLRVELASGRGGSLFVASSSLFIGLGKLGAGESKLHSSDK
jgi:hypothetical protein